MKIILRFWMLSFRQICDYHKTYKILESQVLKYNINIYIHKVYISFKNES